MDENYLFKTLKCSQIRKDEVLSNDLQVSKDTLLQIRTNSPLSQRLIVAGKLLVEKEKLNAVNERVLTAMVADNWNSPRRSLSFVKDELDRVYGQISCEIAHQYNFHKLPSIHSFRVTIGAYKGNLTKARNHWKNFSPSNVDFLEGTTIPVPSNSGRLEEHVLNYLGLLLVDGKAVVSDKRYKIPNSLVLEGRVVDMSLYEDVVSPWVTKIHNRNYAVKPTPVRAGKINPKRQCTYPRIKISSSGIASWICSDVHLFDDGFQSFVGSLSGQDARYMLMGALAGKMCIPEYSTMNSSSPPEALFYQNDSKKRSQLIMLATQANIVLNEEPAVGRLRMATESLHDLLDCDNSLLNSRHQGKLALYTMQRTHGIDLMNAFF